MSKFFTINIGNKDSILLLRNKNKIFQKFSFESIKTKENQDILNKIFKKNKKLFIYIILDNVGQNYNKKKFPAINFFDVIKIVNRKFNYEIPKNDLRDKRFLGRDKVTKEWEYMFISAPIDDYLQEWLEYIGQIENILNGIYMLPLEFENILKKINKKLNIIKNKTQNWTIVLIENEMSGFREITFANGKLVFTRILQEDFIESADNFITYFKENTTQTTEYLKRFYPNFDKNNLYIYIVTSINKKNIIKDSITKYNKENFKIMTFSFNELASILNLNKSKYENSEYGDILCQEAIINDKKIISFSTKEMKQLVLISFINNIFNKFIYTFLFTLLISIFVFIFIFTKNKYDIKNATNSLKTAETILKNKEKQNFGTNIDDLDKIIDFTSFFIDINNLYIDPYEFLSKFSSLVNNNFLVTSIKWKRSNFKKNIFNVKNKSIFQIDSTLINKTGKIDDLFKIYENTDKLFKTNLTDYNIQMSNLPKNINFNTNYFSFPLKIDVTEY